jgi:hypothetical protein
MDRGLHRQQMPRQYGRSWHAGDSGWSRMMQWQCGHDASIRDALEIDCRLYLVKSCKAPIPVIGEIFVIQRLVISIMLLGCILVTLQLVGRETQIKEAQGKMARR